MGMTLFCFTDGFTGKHHEYLAKIVGTSGDGLYYLSLYQDGEEEELEEKEAVSGLLARSVDGVVGYNGETIYKGCFVSTRNREVYRVQDTFIHFGTGRSFLLLRRMVRVGDGWISVEGYTGLKFSSVDQTHYCVKKGLTVEVDGSVTEQEEKENRGGECDGDFGYYSPKDFW